MDSKEHNIINFKYPTAQEFYFSLQMLKEEVRVVMWSHFPNKKKQSKIAPFSLDNCCCLLCFRKNTETWKKPKPALGEEIVDVQSHALQAGQVQFECSCNTWREVDYGQYEGC